VAQIGWPDGITGVGKAGISRARPVEECRRDIQVEDHANMLSPSTNARRRDDAAWRL
jgi:hypothetical protein